MIRRIVLDNFMAHGHTVIEPADGLTVLAGPNNCGKSAVVVALQTLCGNTSGDFMVRHGQKECRVEVQTAEGHVIEWRRKGAVVSYRINGEDIHRVRGQVPEELHRLLGLDKVSDPDGDDTFDIHFADQKHPIFLLDRSGRQAAVFFASSSDAALLMKMQRLQKAKVTQAKERDRYLAAEIDRLDRRVEILQPVEGIDQCLVGLERAQQDLARQAALIDHLGRNVAAMASQAAAEARFAEQVETLACLAPPPALHDTPSLAALCQAIREQAATARANAEHAETLADLREPPVLEPVQPLEHLCRDLASQGRTLRRIEAQVRCLAPLDAPPPQQDTAPLQATIDALTTATAVLRRSAGIADTLRDVPPVPVPADVAPLAEAIGRLSESQAAVSTLQGQVTGLNRELEEAMQAIHRWAEANPICPLCGAPVDAAALIAAGGHAHGQA